MTLYWFKANVVWKGESGRTVTRHIVAANFDEAKDEFERRWVPASRNTKEVLHIHMLEAKAVNDSVTVAYAAAASMTGAMTLRAAR